MSAKQYAYAAQDAPGIPSISPWIDLKSSGKEDSATTDFMISTAEGMISTCARNCARQLGRGRSANTSNSGAILQRTKSSMLGLAPKLST